MAEYSGERAYLWLIEIDVSTNLPTGRRKLNVPEDPDYIAPAINLELCPLIPPTTTTSTSTSTTTSTTTSTSTSTTTTIPPTTTTTTTRALTTAYYKARYPDGRPGSVTYINIFGDEVTQQLTPGGWQDDGEGGSVWTNPTCDLIVDFSELISTFAAQTCTP